MIKKIIFSLTFLISLLLSNYSFSQQTRGWSKETEKLYFDSFAKLNSNLDISATEKFNLSKCCVEQLKKMYPNGMSNVKESTAREAGKKVFGICSSSIKNYKMGWSKQTEDEMRYYVFNLSTIKNRSTAEKNIISNCIIEKLKKAYPQGIDNISNEVAQKIQQECFKN